MATGKQRIPPLPAAENTGWLRELLAAWGVPATAPVPSIFSTLARHPELLRRWDALQRSLLLDGTLPERDRELLILRVAHHCGAAYIWNAHADRHAPAAGLSEGEIARAAEGPGAEGWRPFDVVLLRAADELHATSNIEEATWIALRERYNERQLIELTVVVGEYHLMSFVVNVLGIHGDPDDAPAGAR